MRLLKNKIHFFFLIYSQHNIINVQNKYMTRLERNFICVMQSFQPYAIKNAFESVLEGLHRRKATANSSLLSEVKMKRHNWLVCASSMYAKGISVHVE